MGVGMPSIGPVSDLQRPDKALEAPVCLHGVPWPTLAQPLECIRLARQQIAQALPGLVRKGERDHNDLVALPLGPVNRLLHPCRRRSWIREAHTGQGQMLPQVTRPE